MVNSTFEAYKLKRELKRIGQVYTFFRKRKNDYNEETDELEEKLCIKAIYHEQNGFVQIMSGDTTRTKTKKSPMLLCLYEDAKCLKTDDIVKINNHKFKVVEVVNIQEWNIICDISLEQIIEK